MNDHPKTSKWGLALAAIFLLTACGADGQEPAAQGQAGEARPAAAPAVDDATIAHIAVTANEIDAVMGELALERSSDARVRDFASTMVRDHRGVNEQAVALAGRLGVTPADNDVSRSLQADADATAERLRELAGGTFDRAYMEREVAYHEAVLDALDTTLIPNASNDELRALLVTARGAVAAHLGHARTLGESLAAQGGA